jgi:dUTP pyrophosphatase
MELRVKKLVDSAQLPTRSSEAAVGYDLHSVNGYVILPGRRAIVSTGISVQMPPGVYGRIAPRSGLAVKNGIDVGGGVIDPDYTGELKVVLFNHDQNPFVIKPGYRIAQLILERCEVPPVFEVQRVVETQRGQSGFGSSGN